MIEVRFVAEVKDFSLFRTVQTSLGPTVVVVLMLSDAFSARIKSPGHETDRKNQSSAVIKMAWSYSSTSPRTLMTCA